MGATGGSWSGSLLSCRSSHHACSLGSYLVSYHSPPTECLRPATPLCLFRGLASGAGYRPGFHFRTFSPLSVVFPQCFSTSQAFPSNQASLLSSSRAVVFAQENDSLPGAEETDLYGILGVPRASSKLELKQAYRRLALQFHPDVNPSEDAAATFIRLSRAYEVLADDEQRAAYDKFGVAGLQSSWEGAPPQQASWDAFDTWDEFQPFQRRTRRGDARQAADVRGRSSSAGAGDELTEDDEGPGAGPTGHHGWLEAQLGDVVEYPLSDSVKQRFQDGREKGVGFIVGRNKDRGDKGKLPPENVSLVEIEPLHCEADSQWWRADALESSAFAHLEDLRVLRSEFNRKGDSWLIFDELSEDCGSPVYEDEVIL